MNKMASYKDLINHPNKDTSDRWNNYGVPAAAETVHVFDNMPISLIGCEKLVKAECKIALDAPEAHVIDKATNNIIITGQFDP